MPLMGIIYAAVAAALIAAWYGVSLRYNRRRGRQVLRRIETAFAGHGKVIGVHWTAPSRFYAQLRLSASVFQHASVVVQLTPRELPLTWVLTRLRRQQETLTFEADLDFPPDFQLDVQNHRWLGRTQRCFPRNTSPWHTETMAPFMITTRKDWQIELGSMMDALVSSRERDFVSVSFHRTSPHFSAIIPLEAISTSAADSGLFDVLRELAGRASASRF
jgi:hypothetical protein